MTGVVYLSLINLTYVACLIMRSRMSLLCVFVFGVGDSGLESSSIDGVMV